MKYVWSVWYDIRDFGESYKDGEDYFTSYRKAKDFEDELKAQCSGCDSCVIELTRYILN